LFSAPSSQSSPTSSTPSPQDQRPQFSRHGDEGLASSLFTPASHVSLMSTTESPQRGNPHASLQAFGEESLLAVPSSQNSNSSSTPSPHTGPETANSQRATSPISETPTGPRISKAYLPGSVATKVSCIVSTAPEI